MVKTFEELADELCEYCSWPSESHSPGMTCEGCRCEEAYECYLEENEDEL